LNETRNSGARNMASQMASDLLDRMLLNLAAFDTGGSVDLYRTDWGVPAPAAVNCQTQTCNPAELAQFDLWQWKSALARQLGVLLQVAMPSYEQYVLRGHRGQARATVLQAGQWLERAATAQGTYPAAAQVPADLLRVEGGRYTVVVATTTTSFTITATPSGRQATDGCGTFQVDHTGARSQLQVVGQPLPLTSDECWSR